MSAPIEIPKSAGKPVSELTDRELLEEIATNLRVAATALAAFQSSPMTGMLANMFGGALGKPGKR